MAEIKNKSRKGSADLLIEIIFSAIVFFVVTIIVFGLQIPQQEFKARAIVVSADSAVACDLSLTNMLRANTSTGITYSDWLMNEYVVGNDINASASGSWKSIMAGYLDQTFSSGKWVMNITLPNGTVLLNMGELKGNPPLEAIFTCMNYVPYPAAYSQYFCFPDIPEFTDITSGNKIAKFKTPEGEDVECVINIKPRLEVKAAAKCKLDLAAKNPFEEDLLYYIENTDGLNDSITLPITVANSDYTITVYETVDGLKANAILRRSSLLEDCSLHAVLKITNISAQI